jgi:hypothetical protein
MMTTMTTMTTIMILIMMILERILFCAGSAGDPGQVPEWAAGWAVWG